MRFSLFMILQYKLLTVRATSKIASPSSLGKSRNPAVAFKVIGVVFQYSLGMKDLASSKSSISPMQVYEI